METLDMFTFAASTASIVLAIVAIVISTLSDRRSAESHLKTMEALQSIDKRSAITENTVGENFQNMMKTVLSIVQSATADKEVQKAELAAKAAETSAETQRQLFGLMEEVIKSGDKDKVENFMEVFQAMQNSRGQVKT